MAALRDLAPAYRDAAVRLRLALEEEQARAKTLEGEALNASKGRMALLRGMLRDMRDLRQLAEGYYTRPRDRSLTMAHITVVEHYEE